MNHIDLFILVNRLSSSPNKAQDCSTYEWKSISSVQWCLLLKKQPQFQPIKDLIDSDDLTEEALSNELLLIELQS